MELLVKMKRELIHLFIILLLFTLSICVAESNTHEYSSVLSTCKTEEICEYHYSVEVGRLRSMDMQYLLQATVEIWCESRYTYESMPATWYCMNVTDINCKLDYDFIGLKETQKLSSLRLEELSGVFCFVQTNDGQVASVYHSPDEDESVINFKKGIAAVFQTNFKGTADEIEIDTQSRHHSHYRYSNEKNGTLKMFRTIGSDDIMEYFNGVATDDVQFSEEDDMEYRDGRLVKASGTIDISINKGRNSGKLSDVGRARGNFSIILNRCLSVRKRRSIEQSYLQNLVADGLRSKHDTRKDEIEKLDMLKDDFTAERIVSVLQKQNSTEIHQLEKLMVLERKDGAVGITAIDIVLSYLQEINAYDDEVHIAQRIQIYSLCSSEGSAKAESELVKQMESKLRKEKSALFIAIAMLPTPSSNLIGLLEEKMMKEEVETSSLILVYGALAARASYQDQKRMITYISDKLPQNGLENTGLLIHVLHALGNTKSTEAIKHILRYVLSPQKDVQKTAISALRFFTGLPFVQTYYLRVLNQNTSDAIIGAIIGAIIKSLYTGYEYNRSMTLDGQFTEHLVQLTLETQDDYLISQLQTLLEEMGIAGMMETTLIRHKREKWDSPSPIYDAITPLSEREADLSNFPYNRGYLWTKTLGVTREDVPVYIQSIAGFFAGLNYGECTLKVFGRAVIRANVLGNMATILDVMESNEKIYIEFIGIVILDVEIQLNYTYEFPPYEQDLFEFAVEFTIYDVPFVVAVESDASLGGSLEFGLDYGINNTIEGHAALKPYVSITVEASTALGTKLSYDN